MGNSLVVQQLGLCALNAEGPGSIPSQGSKIPQDEWCSQKTKQNKQNNQSGWKNHLESDTERERDLGSTSLGQDRLAFRVEEVTSGPGSAVSLSSK